LRAVYVPVDTSNPIGRVISIIEDCKPTVTIYDDIERFDGQVINSKLLALAELVEEMPNVVDNVHPEYFQEGDISCIFYTSGSSGVPKGVMVRHDGMLNHLYAKIEAVALDCESVVAQNAPQGFAISIWQLMAPLLNGGQTLIFNTSVVSQVKNFLRDICLKRITVLEVVPSYLGAMLEVIDANDTKEIIQHLQFIVVTGEALSTELVSRWYRKFPKIPLVNAYGQTEATDDVTHYQTVSNDGDGRVALGRPIRNLRVYVMDAHLQLVPVGVRGEICIAGVGVSQGYFNNPELTATVFSHNSHDTNTTYSRLYRTGDIGAYRSNGNLDYFGRKDFQVKLLGHRIELGEIENALLKQAGIRRAAVQLAGNKDGEEFLTAFLVADEGLEKKSLKKKLERALPLKMIPARFVFLKELPLNENGKVDRRIWNTLLLGESEPESITSLTEVQALLFELWKDLLSKKDFSTRDNFFQLGGHSLKVSRMYTAIHRIFGVDVDLKFIFEHPTIEEIATAIESLGLVKRRIIIPRVGQQKYYDLSHIQKNIWVLDKMMKRSDTFHHVESFVYNGSIPQKVFESVMLQLIMRHDILRSSFIMIDHEPKQTILPLENVIKAVEYVDLSSSLHGESSVKERIVELSGRPFDLEKGPLFKVICLPLSPHKTILLLAIHHLISDGWSLQVMARDFLILLNESMSGGGQRFSPLSFQYQDYAAWHNSLLENTEWRKSFEDYWTNKCMNLGESSSLPLDQERPIIKKNIGKRYSFSIDPEQSEKLEKISSRFGATMFVVFQTIIKIWLSRLTGSLDISVGSPVAGRVYSEFEDQVGPYLQVIPFRDRFDEKNSFIDVLSQVRMTSLEAFAHQLYPLDLLRDRLKSKKVVNRNSFFDVGFTLHNQVDNEFLERYEGTTTWDNLQVNEDDVFSSDLYCDLWLTAIKVNSKFEWNLFYDISLFNETTVEKFHVQLLDVVGHVIRNPKVTLDQLHTFRQDISKNEVITLTFN
jgi:amino acid adenylation domain-containing protein